MRFLGPTDMLSAAANVRHSISSAVDEFTALIDVINRAGQLTARAELLLADAEALLGRATAAIVDAEATIKGASASVAESAAASLLASKSLHDTEELIERANTVLASLETLGNKTSGASLGWPTAPADAAALAPTEAAVLAPVTPVADPGADTARETTAPSEKPVPAKGRVTSRPAAKRTSRATKKSAAADPAPAAAETTPTASEPEPAGPSDAQVPDAAPEASAEPAAEG